MKKYLMTGIAALAMVAGFTSCSSNDDLYDPDLVAKTEAEQEAAKIVDNYKANFIKVFGQPAATQTWGFGAPVTRGTIVNVNGNQWTEMPGVTAAEKQLVFNHVNKDKSQVVGATEEYPYNLQNYYVTHVWTGTDTYSTFDGTTTDILGSSKMNNLQIAESSSATITNGDLSATGWFHVNNFNRGNNTDWEGNTLVLNSGTCDFAYHSSEDNNYHNRWIAVPGSKIDPSLAGYYYICFDFMAVPDGCYTVFERPEKNNEKINIEGAWHNIQEVLDAGITKVKTQEWSNQAGGFVDVEVDVLSTWNWTQNVSGNQFIQPNNVYTDWIIRLVEAQPVGDPKLRVMAEDLSANEPSDFDFNDVVFDVEYVNASKVNVTIQAAGGTLPLRVAGREVHDLLNNANQSPNSAAYWDKASNAWVENQPIDVKTMINTNARRIKPELPYKAADGLSPYTFEVTGSWSDNQNTFAAQVRDNIKVEVNKGSDGANNWIELTANQGEPACKIGVLITKPWAEEKVKVNPNSMVF